MAHLKIFIKDTGQLVLAAGNAIRNIGKQKAA
jgi:hypothetical protein